MTKRELTEQVLIHHAIYEGKLGRLRKQHRAEEMTLWRAFMSDIEPVLAQLATIERMEAQEENAA